MTVTTITVRAGGGWRHRALLAIGAAGVAVALAPAPAALADPASPAAPTIVPGDGGSPPAASPQAASVAPAASPQSAATDPAETPAGVPHLPSPENLPPGTTADAPQQGRGMGYLRDLLHAIRTQDVTMNDALLLLAQRPLDTKTAPPPGVSTGPSGPVGSSAGVAPALPADAPTAPPPAP